MFFTSTIEFLGPVQKLPSTAVRTKVYAVFLETQYTETHIRAHQLRFSLHVYFLLRKLFTLDRKSPYVEKNNNT
jgi:hypothetical protein